MRKNLVVRIAGKLRAGAKQKLDALREAVDEQSMRMGLVCPYCQAPRRGICPSGCDDIVRIPGAR